MTAPGAAAAIVLGAGRSERFGAANKLLLEIDGKPLIRTTVDAVSAAGLAQTVVVTGDDAAAVEAALAGCPVTTVRNAAPWAGMGTSLAAGANALDDDIEAAFVVLGDMPRLAPATLVAMLDAFAPGSGRDIAVPVHDGRRGHPVLFAKRYFPALRALSGDIGARALLRAHPERVQAVAVDDPGTLFDIDTPEDAGSPRGF